MWVMCVIDAKDGNWEVDWKQGQSMRIYYVKEREREMVSGCGNQNSVVQILVPEASCRVEQVVLRFFFVVDEDDEMVGGCDGGSCVGYLKPCRNC